MQEEALAIAALPAEMVGAYGQGILIKPKIAERFAHVRAFLEPLGVHLEHSLHNNITVRQAEASQKNAVSVR